MKPQLVKRIAYQPPGSDPAPAPPSPPPPDPIPLDRTHAHVNANVNAKRERRRLITGLAARPEHLCEACRHAQSIRQQIEAFLRSGEALQEKVKRALDHVKEHPQRLNEWNHEGLDVVTVTDFAERLTAFTKAFTDQSDL
jgi:hypothetical protein